MIVYDDEHPKPVNPEVPVAAVRDDRNVKWLEEHCGFRPFGVEW